MVELMALSVVCVCVCGFVAWYALRQVEKQRLEWAAERQKLLDRIQSGNITEFKALERAENAPERRAKDPEKAKWEGISWA